MRLFWRVLFQVKFSARLWKHSVTCTQPPAPARPLRVFTTGFDPQHTAYIHGRVSLLDRQGFSRTN